MFERLIAARDRGRELVEANHGTFRGLVRSTLTDLEYALGTLQPFLRLDAREVHRLVFVCLGNINRSAFAAAVAESQGLRAGSVGLSTTTGAPAFATAVETARAFGVDLSAHAATNFDDYEHAPGDYLLTMETRHARALVAAKIPPRAIGLLGRWASPVRLHLHDPHTLSNAYFLTCFSLINSAVSNLAAELRQASSPCAR